MHGNLSFVRQETERQRLGRIKAEASRKLNKIVRTSKPLIAEVTEESSAHWYLVQTFAGDDLRAMRWLARRRFGVFRPMQQRKVAQIEGQAIGGREPTFPGWLFVYCFDMEMMRKRILACPGVHSLFCFPETTTPVPIDDAFIHELRSRAMDYNERLGHIGQTANRNATRQQPKRPAKLGRKERKALDRIKKALKERGLFEPSTWERLAELAPVQRIALLMRTLQGPVVEGGAATSA